MKPISDAAKGVAPSATLAIDQLAKEMQAKGLDVIAFGAGEPDFNTPEYIKEAGKAAIDNNRTRYTPAAGILELRKAVAESFSEKIGVEYNANQICTTTGAKHNVYISLMATVNPGDEVILPAPFWVSYEESIRMCGGVPVIIETTEATRFKISAEMLENAISEKTKILILNNPSNPTGQVYTKAELEALAEVIVKYDIYVLSDEIYDELTYGMEFVSIASLGEEIRKRTIIINGVSKTYAMTGWRLGYTASTPELTSAMANFLSHSTGSACTISQYASLAAFDKEKSETASMRAAFDERRKYFLERISKIEGVSCLEPKGAFYIFMNIKDQLGKTFYGETPKTSTEFAANLLKNGLVAVVPGDAFGADGYLRWSYATSMENIKNGLDRFEKFLKGE